MSEDQQRDKGKSKKAPLVGSGGRWIGITLRKTKKKNISSVSEKHPESIIGRQKGMTVRSKNEH